MRIARVGRAEFAGTVALAALKLGDYAEGILITPDGKRAFVGVTTDDNVVEIDLGMMTRTRRLSTGLGPDGMAWIGPR